MTPPVDAQRLLDALVGPFGFMLSGTERARILASPPKTAEEFVDTVISGEGLDPMTFDSSIRRSMYDLAARHFGEPVWHGRRQYRLSKRRSR